MTKKRFVAILLCMTLVALAAIGATFAYLTSTDSVTNTFTVGNVKIDLIESSLHRENAGVANGATSDSELWSNVNRQHQQIQGWRYLLYRRPDRGQRCRV